MDATEPRTSFTTTLPAREIDPVEIRSQLDRILAHPQFRNSKRYPALLRHVVERSLEGRSESLKERTIGIDIFGREPAYDTNLDHTVRSSAGEIRKRLAQYYVESEHEDEIRIDLPAGSYVPQFRRYERRASVPALPTVDRRDSSPRASHAEIFPKQFKERRVILSALGVATLVAGALWARSSWEVPSALEQFWAP